MSDPKETDFSTLRFIRVWTPDHIPRHLVEQIKDKAYTIDKYYAYLRKECLIDTETGPQLNPCNLLYVIANTEDKVVGYLWCVIDALCNSLIINNFSMSSDYWYKGKACKLLEAKAKEIQDSCRLDRVYWITQYPKHSQRHGFKESKYVLMEYQPGEVNHGRSRRKDRINQQLQQPAEGLHSSATEDLRAGCTECTPAGATAV